MTGAAHHRGQSRQDYATPWAFIDAVQNRFGPITWDLAASAENAKTDAFFSEGIDSLWQQWSALSGLLWLNPPFANIKQWARKCAAEAQEGARIALLVPASVGTQWFAEHVYGKAAVHFLRPRLSFDGKHPFPKDLMLCVFGDEPIIECWRWK